MTKVLVTGLPRSGTHFLSVLLSECGRDAHHERVFSAGGVLPDAWTGVEVSWLAAPYVSRSWLRGIPAICLTRNPVDIFRSLLGNEYAAFGVRDEQRPWRQYIVQHVPEIAWPSDHGERMLAFMQSWTRLFENLPRVQVEDSKAIANAFDLDEGGVRAARVGIGDKFNHRAPTPAVAANPAVVTGLRELAASWGYPDTINPSDLVYDHGSYDDDSPGQPMPGTHTSLH